MRLGILSDTHGDTRRTAAAVRLLRQVGANALVHCGDVGGAAVIDELAGWTAWLVYGNTDYPDGRLEQYAASLGVQYVPQAPARLELDGRVILAFHGCEPEYEQLLVPAPRRGSGRPPSDHFEYVLHGHTHTARDVRIGGRRFINPGALHRAAVHTVATLDLPTDTVTFWQVELGASETPPRRFELQE